MCVLTKYIENVNAYLSQMKVKQMYLSRKTGIEKNKLSRILNGLQEISGTDMEKIAGALGQKTEYFLSEKFQLPKEASCAEPEVVFYAGEPSKEQVEFAKQLIELIENADVILGAEGRYKMSVGEE